MRYKHTYIGRGTMTFFDGEEEYTLSNENDRLPSSVVLDKKIEVAGIEVEEMKEKKSKKTADKEKSLMQGGN
jgi:predicted butyrate kinase (DUF1464 family)